MNKNTKLLLFALYLLFCPINVYAHPSHPISTKLNIDQTLIDLHTPLIIHQGYTFFPIRDILKPLDAHITHHRKTDSYSFISNKLKISLQFAVNSTSIKINTRSHQMTSPIILYNNRLYAPLMDFFDSLKTSVSKNDNSFLVTSILNKASPHKSSVPSQACAKIPPASASNFNKTIFLSSVSDTSYYQNKNSSLPKQFSPRSNPLLCFYDHEFPLKNVVLFKNNLMFFDPTNFFSKENYQVTKTNSSLIISKNNYQYIFSLTSTKVTIKSLNASFTRNLIHPIIIKNNHPYFPFSSLMKILGFSYYWNKNTHKITLLSNLNRIELVKEKGIIKIRVYSQAPLHSVPIKELLLSRGYYLDLPFTNPIFRKHAIQIDDALFRFITCKKITPSLTRLSLYLNTTSSISSFQETSFGGELALLTTIHTIKETISNNQVRIHFLADSNFKYNVWSLTNPSRLIIDIPNSLSKLPLIYRSPKHVFKNIRSSQFTVTPPSTRIVIDLLDKNKPSASANTNSLTISFPLSKNSSPITTKSSKKPSLKPTPPISKQPILAKTPAPSKSKPSPKPKVKTIKRQRRTSSKNILDNLVIALDPGHGGLDPGAIGINKTYEKNLTIDIANRLRKLLEAKGAFVLMAREKDKNPSLKERTEMANKNQADIFISIHINSFFKPFASGIETYYYKYKDRALASILQKSMSSDLRFKDNGLKRARMYILNHSHMPSALVEPGFLTHPQEYKKIIQPQFRQKIAVSLYKGIVKYFSLTKKNLNN
jgi:N-acetylmuramoyl-L-alanine amidase